jgi:diaminopimelate decarboxylase
MNIELLPPGARRDGHGRLAIAGCPVGELVSAVGTPAFVVDENALRTAARSYLRAVRERWPASDVYFASKAFPCSAIVEVVAQEGLGCDVASAGELAVALAAGMPAERILLHGNAKTVTAYTVVGVKRAGRTFVAVDGGMGDNLEPMLYGTRFAPFVLDADRPLESCDVVGRHCETGDRLVEGAMLAAPRVDDVVVVPMTGAYCFTMANNYNGACRPPVVLCREASARIVVRRETIADLLARDCDVEVEIGSRWP